MATNENVKELRRAPIACTLCRQRKLKCRPSPNSPDGKCIRCVESGNHDCQYIPVAVQNVERDSMSPTEQQCTYDARPSGLPAYAKYQHTTASDYQQPATWPAQSGGIPMNPTFVNAAYGPSTAPSYSPSQRPSVAYPPVYNGPIAQQPSSSYYGGFPAQSYNYPQTSQVNGQVPNLHMPPAHVRSPPYPTQYGTTQQTQNNGAWSNTNIPMNNYALYPNSGGEDIARNYPYQPHDLDDYNSQE